MKLIQHLSRLSVGCGSSCLFSISLTGEQDIYDDALQKEMMAPLVPIETVAFSPQQHLPTKAGALNRHKEIYYALQKDDPTDAYSDTFAFSRQQPLPAKANALCARSTTESPILLVTLNSLLVFCRRRDP